MLFLEDRMLVDGCMVSVRTAHFRLLQQLFSDHSLLLLLISSICNKPFNDSVLKTIQVIVLYSMLWNIALYMVIFHAVEEQVSVSFGKPL